MTPTVKSILIGLLFGLAPLIACTLLFYGVPILVDGNPGALLSFGLMGMFFLSSIGVFIASIVLIVRKKNIIGITALISLVSVWVAGFAYLISYTD